MIFWNYNIIAQSIPSIWLLIYVIKLHIVHKIVLSIFLYVYENIFAMFAYVRWG